MATTKSSKSVKPVSHATQTMYSEGAEFLVLGELLIRGIHATKSYTGFTGWDVLAANPRTGKTARIQVKARLATDFDGGFPIKNVDSDFVVLVALNRGYRYKFKNRKESGVKPVEYFVIPIASVKKAIKQGRTWGSMPKVHLQHLDTNKEELQDNWKSIQKFLGVRNQF
jgi:hypothetical protein